MRWAGLITPTSIQTLTSGARLVVLDRPGLRNAICLSHVRGGSRSDPPDAAGTAHLTEHLLVQGLAPDDERWVTPVVAAGGDLSATTHPDYLEFCFEGPHEALPMGLAAERERLAGWPRLREGELAKQRAGVCREIEQHGARATRTLPWPELGPRLFGTWADGHDPFGEVEHVQELTVDDCHRFSVEHHRPECSVVVVLADLAKVDDALRPQLESACPAGPSPSEPAGHADSSAAIDLDGIVTGPDWSAPHSVGALGWRVPSVVDEPDIYAGLLVVAAYAGRVAGGRGRVGQMLPMDQLAHDALTVTTVHPLDARASLLEAQRQVEALARGRTPHPSALDAALRQARSEVATLLDRPRGAAQLVARAGLLAGDPQDAGVWVEAVERISEAGVHAAAARLQDSAPVGVVRRPRAAQITPRPHPASALAPTSPVHLLRVERPTLTASVSARVSLIPTPEDVARLRADGCRVVKDVAGWVVSRTTVGRADDLLEELGTALGSMDVRHVAAIGPHASAATPWPVVAVEAAEPAMDRDVEMLSPDEAPPDVAGAQLRWRTGPDGFLARWLGIALLADIQARSHGADPHPLSSPPETALSLRQEAIPGDRSLVFEVWSAPERLPEALAHLAAELGPVRLTERARGVPDAAVSLAGQWLRDECDGATLARRVTSLLDLGAEDDDVLNFDARLREVTSEMVVDRLLLDTAGAPHGWIRTNQPDLLDGTGLPWLTALR